MEKIYTRQACQWEVEKLAAHDPQDWGTHYKVGDNEDEWQTNAILEMSRPGRLSIPLSGRKYDPTYSKKVAAVVMFIAETKANAPSPTIHVRKTNKGG